MKRIIEKLSQRFADLLISRMEQSNSSEEFETWFTMALYLDLYCTNKGIYLN
jgi:hypothetical protein